MPEQAQPLLLGIDTGTQSVRVGICGATRDCLQKVGVDERRLAGISFDATSSTVLLVERDGRPLGPAILWMDQRAVQEVEEIARTRHPVLKYSGGQDSAEWMVPKAL
jgi:ribulose kinase